MENEFSIESVMEEIRNEIKEKGLKADILSFKEVANVSSASEGKFTVEGLNASLANMGDSYSIPESRPLIGNPIVVFIKRVIRKLTRFYIKPIVEAQTEFNAYTAQTANMMGMYICSNIENGNGDELRVKVEMLELKLKTAMSENQMLVQRVEALEKRLSETK